MKKLIFLLLLIPVCLARTVDFGEIYPEFYYSDVFNISVNYTSNFTILVNATDINGVPVILFDIKNVSNITLADSGYYLTRDFFNFEFPETTKTLYYRFALDFYTGNLTDEELPYGNNTLYITIYDHNLNLLDYVEIKFYLLRRPTIASTLMPPIFKNTLMLVPLLFTVSLIYWVGRWLKLI